MHLDEAPSERAAATSQEPQPDGFLDALRQECIKRPFECVTMFVTLVGVVAAVLTLMSLREEAVTVGKNLETVKHTLDSQAYANIYRSAFHLDEIFLKQPEYRTYFDKGTATPNDEKLQETLKSIAVYKLDFIDFFFSQRPYLRTRDSEYWAWISYFEGSFARGPILCSVLADDPTEFRIEVRYLARKECKTGPGLLVIPISTADAELARTLLFSKTEEEP